jgi:hypothetical protein
MKIEQLLGINEEVERRLQEAQKNKEFKDVGKRVSGSAKEKRAQSAIINSSDLSNLEKDDATAIETIVKDRVWPKVVAQQELDNGVSSGCAFLKHAIRAAYPAKPQSNSHFDRRVFIGMAESIQRMLVGCYTISDVKNAVETIETWKGSNVPFLFDEDFLATITDEELDKRFGTLSTKYRIKDFVSSEFFNVLFRASNAGAKTWMKALEYDGITEEQEQIYRERHTANFNSKISHYQQMIIEHSTADYHKLKELKRGWRGMPDDLEAFRQKAIEFCSNKIKEFEKALAEFPKQLQQRPPDWSWSGSKKTGERQRPELVINQPPPLSFIKRIGGLEITQVSQQEIIDQFGFKYVEFGNSISDKEAREHVRHFLGALVDLFEILNINQKEINEAGELSIAFASRGRKGSAASYNRLHRIININRSNGDGSVAHEWMHYLDHLFWQKFKRFDQTDLYKLASEKLDLLIDTDATRAFKDLCNTLRKGSGVPKKIKTYFEASGEHNYRNAVKEDIDSTLAHLKNRHSYIFNDSQQNSFRDARRVFGYVAHHFNQSGIVVEREISRHSLFFYYSAQMSSDYWIKPQELLARAFETYIFDKLTYQDRFNNYLVNSELYDHPLGIYPGSDERDLFLAKFEAFFSAMKKDLSVHPFVPFTARRTEEYIVLDTNTTEEEKVESGVVVASELSELLRLEVSLFKAA